VIFQEQTETSNATPAEQERVEPEPPIIVDVEDNDDFELVHLNGTTSSEDNDSDDNDIYGIEHDFPQHECGGMRRFLPKWFSEFSWLEYSVDKDAAYCFVCYLFKVNNKLPGGDAFVNEGFRNWNVKASLLKHVGVVDSAHCEAEEKYNLFLTPKASIRESVASNTSLYKAQYLARLTWSLKCIRFLLHQGLAFRGHDEGNSSIFSLVQF
jgi:rhodanese-related sulfurtransferase